MKYFLTILIYSLFSWNMCLSYKYKELYFKQKVDHFGYTNGDYFLQRYLVNLDSYNRHNGTIFFYTGNEGEIEMFTNNTGFMWENAEKFNAGLVFAEHRYYGKSMPYGNDSFKDNKKLGYLSSEQALADFAALIYNIKTTLPGANKAPVIAFGGSYGGMLSAWIRMKYPHLVDGSIASSAPIWQFKGMTSCGKFAEIVTRDFAHAGPSCPKSVRKSWNVIRKIGSTDKGTAFLTETFKLCEPLYPPNISSLISWLQGTWEYLAMTDYPYPTSFLVPLPAKPINEVCKFLKDSTVPDKELISNIFKAASVYHNYTGSIECNDLTVAGGGLISETGWDYQSCTEMVMPMCSDGISDMYEPSPWNFTEFAEECYKRWSLKPDLNTAYIIYGGKNITASSNIIFSNGKLDPWISGGVLESLSSSLIAIVIENAAHHLDLRSSNHADPPSVKNARQTILSWIRKWICEVRKC